MHVDILSIHYRIIDYLNTIADKNQVLFEQQEFQLLQELKRQYSDHNSTIRPQLQLQIEALENNFQQISDRSLLHFYLLKTQMIIDEYKALLNKPIIIDFMKCENKDHDQNHYRREALIRDYLHLIKKHFASFPIISSICCDYDIFSEEVMNHTKNRGHSHGYNNGRSVLVDRLAAAPNSSSAVMKMDAYADMECLKCGNRSTFETFDNQNVCGECGIVLDQYNQQGIISFKDGERVNMNSKYTYDRKTHFKDCLYQFQGKQNVSIDKTVYDDILEQLISYSIIPENYHDLPKEMAFEKVTKEHIFLFLKHTRHVKHYEDATLIYHHLTGKPIPDISHLEEALIRDFDLLVDQYDRKYRSSTDRKNFINTQYILYQLLNRHHYHCCQDDFNMLKTIDRKYYHDEVCSILFEELGWNHRPIF